MKYFKSIRHAGRAAILAAMIFGVLADAPANPTGLTVASGTATTTQSGSQMTITASQNAFLNWQSFNIAAGEKTIFQQPSASSVVWNKINDSNPSQIFGSLQANGVIVLMNSSGFYFGPNSFVSVAGLVVSTANCAPPENSGGSWEFNGPPPLASIINYGHIQVGNGGQAFVIADQIENHGTVEAPGGTVGLAAGQTVLLSERPDGRGMSMQVKLPQGSVDNYGNLVADAGTIALQAQVMNQNGALQANSVKNENGVIELVAADQLNLGANSLIQANGDNSALGSAGGNVTLKSGNNFSDSVGSQITVTGGAHGGNGGNVEVSAPNLLSLQSEINARAQAGSTAGKLLLDPDYIILDSSGSGSAGDGTVLAGDNPGTVDLNVVNTPAGKNTPQVDNAFANLAVSEIILQAAYDITLMGDTAWDLSGTIGSNLGGVTGGKLTLEAGRNIIFGDNSSISDANGWSVSLKAGASFPSEAVQPDSGSVYLTGGTINGVTQTVGGSVQTTDGSINVAAGLDIQTGVGSLIDNNAGFPFALESATGNISLNAGRDIEIGSGALATTSGGNITATAGRDLQMSGGSISTLGAGDIAVTAGQDIEVGSGSITTDGGGNITATAVAGSVNTGTDTDTYAFTFANTMPYYTVDASSPGLLGGISTAAGGDVSISAGLDIISYLPGGSIDQGTTAPDAGSGAFGPGNVTLNAGRNVEGHFIVAAGTGIINAGNNAGVFQDDIRNAPTDGSGARYLALSLSQGDGQSPGGWEVDAGQDILLQEVRNPNGIFNETSNPGKHLFDYGPDDFVTLNAGNSVQMLGNGPRNSDEVAIPIIYPPTLDITAGAGGVILGQSIILYPSPQGSLNITITGGGNFESVAAQQAIANNNTTLPSTELQFIMSDHDVSNSESQQYLTFSIVSTDDTHVTFGIADHAAVPVHLENPTTVALNISGDLNDIELVSPEATQINVVGNINNSSLINQNLPGRDVTSIDVGQTAKQNMETSGILNPATDSSIAVGGDIINAGEFNSIVVPSEPDLPLLNSAYDPNTGQLNPLADLAGHLHYDATTGQLTFQGQMSAAYENDLHNLQVVTGYNADGTPQTATVQILTAAEAKELQMASLNAPLSQNPGFFIGGGGQLDIAARNVNLGSTLGIQSVGPGNGSQNVGQNHALANYFNNGAEINLTLSGNLDIFSTTISAINGGDINVRAGFDPIENNGQVIGYNFVNPTAQVNVGSPYFAGDDSHVRGIFTAGEGNVLVNAGGDINLNGSRIAAYDGGNVTVESFDGNVDAGNGGSGSVSVNEIYVNPVTHQAYNYSPTIPGSGILATTFPPRNNLFPAPEYSVGNILIETPQGNINASAGGILQFPLNQSDSSAATVTLLAGEDAAGNIISTGRDINASGSGVVGSIVTLKASGNINGLIFARGNINISAQQNVNVTALAEGTVSANAGGSISGTIIGVGGISASSSSIDAALLSNNSISGATSGQSGLAQGTAANSASAAASNDSNQTVAKTTGENAGGDDLKKGQAIGLARKVGRVRVILPGKTKS